MNHHEAFNALVQHWGGKYSFSPEELEGLKALFVYHEFEKREFLIQEGQIEHRIYFVVDGILRAFFELESQEITAAFVYSGFWSSSFGSFLSQSPSAYSIEVLEPCRALSLNRETLEVALRTSPNFAIYYRILLENVVVGMQFRERELMGSGAEERFNRFMAQSAFLTQKLPLKYIASYLSMTPETFSRLRRKSMK